MGSHAVLPFGLLSRRLAEQVTLDGVHELVERDLGRLALRRADGRRRTTPSGLGRVEVFADRGDVNVSRLTLEDVTFRCWVRAWN
jgi:hypothetical protein